MWCNSAMEVAWVAVRSSVADILYLVWLSPPHFVKVVTDKVAFFSKMVLLCSISARIMAVLSCSDGIGATTVGVSLGPIYSAASSDWSLPVQMASCIFLF